jgi:hypothetical protein
LFVGGQYEQARGAYERGLAAARAGSGDDYAAPLCLAGLAHLTGMSRGAPEEVRRLADEALEIFARASNVSATVPALQRYAEALDLAGDRDGAQVVRERRQRALESLVVPAADFWPRVPPGGTVAPVEPIHFWQTVVERRQSTGPGSSTVVERADIADEDTAQAAPLEVSQTIEGEASAPGCSLLERLATIEGYKPSF